MRCKTVPHCLHGRQQRQAQACARRDLHQVLQAQLEEGSGSIPAGPFGGLLSRLPALSSDTGCRFSWRAKVLPASLLSHVEAPEQAVDNT